MPHAARWTTVASSLAALKIVTGMAALVAAVTGVAGAWTPWHLLFAAHVVAYGASGAVLLAGGRRDPRARLLGVVLLMVASVFADSTFGVQRAEASVVHDIARAVMAIRVDAFMPWFLWRFVRAFPTVVESAAFERRFGMMVRASVAIGVVLFVANTLLWLATVAPALAPFAAPFRVLARSGAGAAYWALQFTLAIVALPTLTWKARRAPVTEQRRVALLVAGFVAGTAPVLLWVLLTSLAPAVGAWLPLAVVGWLIYPAMLSVPASTAYAVLVRQALDVALVVRRALQHALARWTVIALSAIPVVLLAGSLYRRRHASLLDVVSTPAQLALAALATLGILTLRRRNRVLTRIDQRYFREQYDARVILGQLVDRCNAARDHGELAAVLRAEIDRALHLESVSVLFLDEVARAYVSPADDVRPLPVRAALAELVGRSEGTLDVDVERPSPSLRRLVPEELHWVADGGFLLLLPLRDPAQRLVGLVALGARKSELPFSKEDLALLRAVGQAAEMTLAYHGVRLRSAEDEDRAAMAFVGEQPAAECTRCGAVQPTGHAFCARCGAGTVDCALPQVVAGKFLVDERAGAGGMGIVYRAMDVHLGRLVAIKTLPRVSPDEAMRLRREARAAAAVSHPNLALIFGAETWQGRPMLVFEYLAGGTLADRLRRGPLPAHEALQVAATVADALAAIHDAGVLHGDVKPSNIGFAADGTPKLLDFGLARILDAVGGGDTGAERATSHALRTSGGLAGSRASGDSPGWSLSESGIRGTPLYMSPEALGGQLPDPSFDLWALCLVLYESVAGRHPLGGVTLAARLAMEETVPSPESFAPGTPAALAAFLVRALSERAVDRPRSAAELRDTLRQLATDLELAGSGAGRSESRRLEPV